MARPNKNKFRINITIDRELNQLLSNRKENKSALINSLLWKFLALENNKSQDSGLSTQVSNKRQDWDLNPEFHKEQDFQAESDLSLESRELRIQSFQRKTNLFSVYKKHKDSFIVWLEKYSSTYAQNVVSTMEKLFKSNRKTIDDIKKFILSGSISKKSSSVSLRVWLNFCEEFEYLSYQEIDIARKKVKLYNKTNIDSFVPTKKDIENSLSIIFDTYSREYYLLYRFMIESGCRFSELKELLLNFDYSKLEQHNEIGIYRNFHLRGSKSSFYLFFRYETIKELIPINKNFSSSFLCTFKKNICINKNIINLKYLRKYNFSLLVTSGINLEIANYIQGRASKNIGFTHYLAKKELSLKEYNKIINLQYKNNH